MFQNSPNFNEICLTLFASFSIIDGTLVCSMADKPTCAD